MKPGKEPTIFSPDPILKAFDAYRGSVVDLDAGKRFDATDLQRGRDQLVQGLGWGGIDPGDRVVLAVENGPLFLATLCAVLQLDGSPLLVPAKSPAAELQRIALRFGARAILGEPTRKSDLESIAKSCQLLKGEDWLQLTVAEIDPEQGGFAASFPPLPGVPLHPTSGTTSEPKIAVRPGPCAMAEAENYVAATTIDEGDVVLAVPPMSHAYGYGMCAMVPLLTGAHIATLRKFKPSVVLRAIEELGISVMPATPGMLDALLYHPSGRASGRANAFPRWVFSAGAPLPERTASAFKELTGIPARPLYGTTETGGISIASSEDQASCTGCVGTPLAGVSAEVRERAPELDSDKIPGTLHIRSSSMMAGYLRPDGIDDSLLRDGWFDTGDLARIDEDGAVHLSGRETELINVDGQKVVPGEVEAVIAALPNVGEVKVYAGSLEAGYQIVKAAIVPTGELDSAQIRAHCQQQLVFYKRPTAIHLLDSLPKTPSGKVIVGQLPQRPSERPAGAPAVSRRASPSPAPAAENLPEESARYEIETHPLPTREEFVRRFVAASTPVVFSGAMEAWYREGPWTFDWFRRHGADQPARARFAGEDRITTVGEYCERVAAGASARECGYLAQLPVEYFPELAARLKFPNFYSIAQLSSRLLWIGPAGTRSPLHCDFANNLIAQTLGTKRFRLYAPSLESELPGGARSIISLTSGLPTSSNGVESIPAAPDYDLVLEAGQMLFLPEGWWHSAMSLAPSITATEFWVDPDMLERQGLVLQASEAAADQEVRHLRFAVARSCPLIAKTIDEAGLRRLYGLFLTKLERAQQRISPIDTNERLQAEDLLVYKLALPLPRVSESGPADSSNTWGRSRRELLRIGTSSKAHRPEDSGR